jgi:hypothetical protein
MKVKELKAMLDNEDDEMEVIHGMYSDYQIIVPEDWSVIEAVDQGGYVMKAHRTMSEDNRSRMKTYLALAGN